MAGNYPDVPAPRMAYDRDGTIMYYISGYTSYEYGTSTMQILNNESGDSINVANGGGQRTRTHGFIFPEPRTITGLFISMSSSASTIYCDSFQTSVNTTNGYDGTWTGQTSVPYSGSVVPYRTSIQTVNWAAIKAFRFRVGHSTGAASQNTYQHTMHIYGTFDRTQNPDCLRMWHPTLDEPLDDGGTEDGAYMDWGDVVRGTASDRQFRIKNNSSSLTANSISISTEVPTNTSPTLDSQITYSDGGTFGPSINIGNLGPGAISPVLTVRKTTSSNAVLSIWALRTVAEAASWS